MKTFIVLIIIGFVQLTACHKSSNDKPATNCLEQKILEFSKSSSCNNSKVDEYLFQGKSVFVFDPGNCGADMALNVLNSDCLLLGFLGGISGNTKINGEEFSNAKFIKTWWEN